MTKHSLFILFILCSNIVFGQVNWEEFDHAVKLQNEQKYDSAILIYSKILMEDSTVYGCLYNRAISYLEIEEYKNALIDIKKANRIYETDSSLYLIGLCLGHLFRYDESVYYLKKAREKGYPDEFDYNFILGTTYYFINEIDSAKRYLQEAYAINPKNEDVLTNLGFTYEISNPSKSCGFFKEAYIINDSTSSNVNNLGYSYYLCGNQDSALKYFNKAIILDPNNSYVYRNLGLLNLEKGNKQMACENYGIAIGKNFIEQYGVNAIHKLKVYCDEK